MKRVLALLLAAASAGLAVEGPALSRADDIAAGSGGMGRPDSSRCLVGIYYFAGWWEPLPNKYTPDGKDWRKDYVGRVPLLGQYNDQPTMDKEIVAAAESGVDFFQILWYPVDERNAGGWRRDVRDGPARGERQRGLAAVSATRRRIIRSVSLSNT